VQIRYADKMKGALRAEHQRQSLGRL
jgi:hypothetical protein